MKPHLHFLLLLTAASGNALAAQWIPLAGASSSDQYYYDRSKLTIKGDSITYWKKVVFKTSQNIGGNEVVSGLLRERIHCAEHTAKLVSYLYYSADGETVQYVAKDESDPAPIIPDSVGDAFERTLCPLVWRKQEETRIKAEQKAAEAELKQPAKDKDKEEAEPAIAPPVQPAPPQSPNVRLPEKQPVLPQLPMPQIMEQSY